MKLKIENGVLKECDGTESEIILPDGITEIKSNAFTNFANIERIVLCDSVKKLHFGVFDNFSSLKEIVLSRSLSEIGENCFAYCSALERITIPEGVRVIREFTFSGCSSLKEVFLPSTVELIDSNAFFNCIELTDIHCSNEACVIADDAFTGCRSLGKGKGPIIIGDTLYVYQGNESRLIIPDDIKHIMPGAFKNNPNLEFVEIPGTIEIIPERCFESCQKLQKAVLHNGLKKIGKGAFAHCHSIDHIVIPDSVSEILGNAFSMCKSLTEIKLSENIEEINPDTFYGCSALKNVLIPDKVKYIHSFAFWSSAINKLNLTHITRVDSYAFDSSNIKEVEFRNLELVSEGMLYNCNKLKSVYIDDTVTKTDGGKSGFINTKIPFIHISSKLINGLPEEDKKNAVETYLRNENDYSDEGKRDWLAYIKRNKMRLLKWFAASQNLEMFSRILELVTLSEKNYSTNMTNINRNAELSNNECVDFLKNSPLYAMSLHSKELFHSNFWAWLINKDRKYAKVFFSGIDCETITDCKREEGNRDITIHCGDKLYVIENKLKSLPNEEQLKEYKKKCGSSFICGIVTGIEEPSFAIPEGWNSLTYSDISDRILEIVEKENADDFDSVIIKKYVELLKCIDSVIKNTVNNIGNRWGEDSDYSAMVEIRLDDIVKKLNAKKFEQYVVSDPEFEKMKTSDKHWLWHWTDFSRNDAYVDFRLSKIDKMDGEDIKYQISTAVQIQRNQYRIMAETKGKGWNFEKTYQCFLDRKWFEEYEDGLIRGKESSMRKEYCIYEGGADDNKYYCVYQYFNLTDEDRSFDALKKRIINDLSNIVRVFDDIPLEPPQNE